MYMKRTDEDTILKLSESFPCLVTYRSRQTGKFTAAEASPRLFLETNP